MFLAFKINADVDSLKPPIPYTTPAANDEQTWQRETGDNIATLAMAYLLTKTTQPSSDTFWLEAEETPLTSPMIKTADATVSAQGYISTPVGGSPNSPNAQPPSASYNISTQIPAYYHIWALVYAPSSSSNNFFLNVDGNESSISTNTFGAWLWVNCGHWHLTPGNHVMNLTYQKQGMRFDKFCVTADGSLVPTGLGTEQHWVEAENFTLNANGVAPHLNNLLVTAADSLAPLGDSIAQGKKWLETWAGNTGLNTLPGATSTPDAQQTIGLNGGNYDVWMRFKAPYVGHDSIYFELDTLGFTTPALDGTVVFPYNTIVSPTLLLYNKTLSSPNNTYAYREWVWKKVASNVALTSGNHILKIAQVQY